MRLRLARGPVGRLAEGPCTFAGAATSWLSRSSIYPRRGKTAPQHHLYDEVFYVLSGHGSAIIQTEWGPRSLFSPPLNAPFQLFNCSGVDSACIVSANDLPLMMNMPHAPHFIVDNPWRFLDRAGKQSYYAGEGDFLPLKPGKHMWETNFVPDLGTFTLPDWEARGTRSKNINIIPRSLGGRG